MSTESFWRDFKINKESFKRLEGIMNSPDLSQKRDIIIADLHGNHVGLNKILIKANYNPKEDNLIFTGDYIDGYKDADFSPKELINLIISLKKENKNIFPVLGNHDFWMLEWITSGSAFIPEIWYYQGGKETLDSYGFKTKNNFISFEFFKESYPKEHLKFLKSLSPYYKDELCIVIHGGFSTKKQMDLIKEDKEINHDDMMDILWNRTFYQNHNFRNLSLDTHFKSLFGDKYCIMGHTPSGPIVNDYKILIDGGSKGGGKLYGIIINSDKTYKIISEKSNK
jgi:hypothetical protein